MYILLLIILALVAWLVLQTQSLKRELLQIQQILSSLPSGQLAASIPQSAVTVAASPGPHNDPASPEKLAEPHRLRTNLYSFNLDYDGPGKDEDA